MTDKQIKSAKGITETTLKKRGHLSECFCAYCFADKTNINLAQSYLSVGKEMLEERSLNKECPQPYSVGYEQRIPEIKGFNEARRLCIMAKMKSVPSVEELKEVIKKTKYVGMVKHYELVPDWIESIAQAIYSLLTGGEEERKR